MASVRRKMSLSFVFHICLLLIQCSWGRDHSITLEDEERRTFELSKFGFLQGGVLKVNFTDMVFKEKEGNLQNSKDNFGFSLEKTTSDGISPYMEQHAEKCILKNGPTLQERISVALIKFDLKSETIVIERFGEDFLNLTVVDVPLLTTTAAPVSTTSASTTTPPTLSVEQNNSSTASTSQNTSTTVQSVTSSQNSSTTVESVISTKPVENSTPATTVGTPEPTVNNSRIAVRRKREVVTTRVTPAQGPPITLPLTVTTNNESKKSYSGRFIVYVNTKAEEGLYNLYFHNCANYNDKKNVKVNIKIQIKEKNHENYLSAGEEPLPYMFGVLSVIFLVTAVYWFRVLRQNREYTYKVHYMMFVLVLLKALDLAFQAVNNHFISRDGKPAESWAVLYYITHLLKGALLFTTIVLIGTGYFFVKHVLSDRDKKIFIIVIPLQILANTAQIVMESTEEAKLHYTTWKEVFILVDLLCCGAILFPVVWSIRHLQEASQTDGKAAINLAKLKLFRHFYVMIVCYIYFTRIIVYLIKITVPFQYMWLDDFFNNVASYVFFVLTGYKFRPAPDNPYLHVPQEESDEEIDMEEVVTTAGLAKGVTRLQPSSDGRKIFETA